MAKKQGGDHFRYAALILDRLQELIDDESIGSKELNDKDNLKDFLYALGTVAPIIVANKLTGNDYDPLTFNHMQNHLVFEYTKDEYERPSK